MHRQLTRTYVVLSALFFVACSKPGSEAVSDPRSKGDATPAARVKQVSSAEATGAADATVVDPDRYTVEFENDAVRILRITYGAGEESVMHYHPDSVAVFLTDIEAKMTLPDGSIEDIAAAAGDAVFSPAGAHQPKNVSDSDWEIVEVELKPRQSAQRKPGGPDATVVDPDHYMAEFENAAVRIVRIKYGAGDESVMHYHPDSVAVFVTDHLVQMTMPDGSTDDISAAAGDVLFIPGGQHLPKNISSASWELVLIELKR